MTFLQASTQLKLEQLGPTTSSAKELLFQRPLAPPLKRRKLLQEAADGGNFDNTARRDAADLGSVFTVRVRQDIPEVLSNIDLVTLFLAQPTHTFSYIF